MKKAVLVVFSVWALFGLLKANVISSAAGSDLTRTHSGGGVAVKVTYLNAESKDVTRFQVVLDTHSVNLDVFDLKALSLLRGESGKTYEPTGVENKGSGHHREVVLTFSKGVSETKRIELVLQDIAGVKERIFRWDLNER